MVVSLLYLKMLIVMPSSPVFHVNHFPASGNTHLILIQLDIEHFHLMKNCEAQRSSFLGGG